jgi:hypothetical protein
VAQPVPIFTLAVMEECVPNSIWLFSVSSVSSSAETEEPEAALTFGRSSSPDRIRKASTQHPMAIPDTFWILQLNQTL